MFDCMSDVTRILSQMESGAPSAAEELLPLVYDELRKLAADRMAQEKPGQTLQATALVHEAYLRLVEVDEPLPFRSRGYFFAAAAEAMRRILIDHARRKGRQKRGGNARRVDLEHVQLATDMPPDQLLLLNESIERLASEDGIAAQLVRLRYYAGLSLEQTAEVLGISVATAYRHWAYARAWLHCALEENTD